MSSSDEIYDDYDYDTYEDSESEEELDIEERYRFDGDVERLVDTIEQIKKDVEFIASATKLFHRYLESNQSRNYIGYIETITNIAMTDYHYLVYCSVEAINFYKNPEEDVDEEHDAYNIFNFCMVISLSN